MNALSCGLSRDFHMMWEKQPWGSRVVPRNEDYVIMKKKETCQILGVGDGVIITC